MAKRKTEEPAVANDNPVYVEPVEPQSALYTAVEMLLARVDERIVNAQDISPEHSKSWCFVGPRSTRIVIQIDVPTGFAAGIITK